MYNAYESNTLIYEPALCNGCALCVAVCPHAVFKMKKNLAVLARPQACMECGACMRNCLGAAIKVDSGVGCANAMIRAALLGLKEPECNCC